MKINDSAIRRKFAESFQRILRNKGIEQKKLAIDLNLSTATVSDWYNGRKYPKPENMQMLADYLGCSVSELRDFGSNNPLEKFGLRVTGMIPVYGEIPAGRPISAQEHILDYVPVLLPNAAEYFGLRVKGDSMIGAGITEGCIVLIHKQTTAENNQIVACRVNGDEATLKRFRLKDDNVYLLPENSKYDPLVIPTSDFLLGEAEILGVVKQIIINV